MELEKGRLRNLPGARGVGVVAVLAWVVFVYTWFDHELGGPFPRLIPLTAAALLLVSLGFVVVRGGFPRPFREVRDNRLVALFAGLAVLSRLPFLAGAYGLFSSDAAVLGVMALHIFEGKHHPIFLYRWSYVGSLKAHLTALLMVVFREPVLCFALAAILVYGMFAGASYALARQVLSRKEAALATAYVVVAPGFLTAWGMHNEGNYLDVLALGTMMLVLGSRMVAEPDARLRRALWLGVLGGLAFWSHILATYYLLAALLLLVAADWSRRAFPRLAAFGAGFLLGDLPGLLWNASHAWLSFRWWTLDRATEADRLNRAAAQLWEVFTTSFGVLSGRWPADYPPWPDGLWRPTLSLLIPIAFVVFVVRFRDPLRAVLRGRLNPESLIVIFTVLVVAVFAQSSFGWMTEEPRYLLFLFSVIPIFLAAMVGSLWRRSKAASLTLVVLIAYVNLHGSGLYWARAVESDGVNRRFVREVEELGIRYAHTDYYISYKYDFLSHGRLVLTSALGPSRTEWYEPYREEAARANRVALIPRSYRMARRIERRLKARGISYRRANLLYPVLFDISEKVDPKDLL